jgi:protein-disulfide isomerase
LLDWPYYSPGCDGSQSPEAGLAYGNSYLSATGPSCARQYAASLGLDTSQFNPCLDSGKYLSVVEQQSAEAQRLGVTSTPSILVDGKLVSNPNDYASLKAAIDAALPGQ